MYFWSFIFGVLGLAGMLLGFQKVIPQDLNLVDVPLVVAAAVMGIAVNRKPYKKGFKGILGLIGLASSMTGTAFLLGCILLMLSLRVL